MNANIELMSAGAQNTRQQQITRQLRLAGLLAVGMMSKVNSS